MLSASFFQLAPLDRRLSKRFFDTILRGRRKRQVKNEGTTVTAAPADVSHPSAKREREEAGGEAIARKETDDDQLLRVATMRPSIPDPSVRVTAGIFTTDRLIAAAAAS